MRGASDQPPAVQKLAKLLGRAAVREGLERLVAKYLSPLVATTALLMKDVALKMQLQRHQFVTLEHLEIPTDPPPCNDMVLSLAAAELRRMNSVRRVEKFLFCLVWFCLVWFRFV